MVAYLTAYNAHIIGKSYEKHCQQIEELTDRMSSVSPQHVENFIVNTFTGVNQRKYYAVGKDSSAAEAISKISAESEFDKREEVFSQYRNALQEKFRKSERNKQSIQLICRPFFMHSQHLSNHFSWLTEAPCLDNIVEKNFISQIGMLL